jgi:hypothetical protein
LALVASIALSAAPALAQDSADSESEAESGAEPVVRESWYAERIGTGDSPVRVEHLWSKQAALRSETVFAGHPILTLVKGNRYLIIDRLTRHGISVERSPEAVAEDAGRTRPFGDESGGEQVRTEEIGGRSCDLYRLTDGRGRREVCVSQDAEQLPLVERVWNRQSGARAETRYLEWTHKMTIGDAFFEPDPRVTLEHYTYEAYLEAIAKQRVGPAPPFHPRLLHGSARIGL